MPLDAKRYKINFDHQTLTFDETLPEGLNDLIRPEEFDAILRKINTELNQEALEACRKMKRMGTVYGPLSLAFIGLLLTFNMARRARRCRKALLTFFKNVEDLLNEWNKKTFLRKKIDWRLVQDKKYIRGRDAANPFFAYRIDILHKLGRRRGRDEGSSREDSGAGVGSRTDSITLPSNVKFEGSVGAGASGVGEETGGSQNQRGSISSLKRVSFTDDLLKDFKTSNDDEEEGHEAGKAATVGAVAAGVAAASALHSTSDDNQDQTADRKAVRARKRVSFTSENFKDEGFGVAEAKKEDVQAVEDDDDDDDLMIVSSTPVASSLPARSSQLKSEAQPVVEEDDDDDEIFVKRPE